VNMQRLADRFGRQVDYVRISVTDRCDFRCVYCMAEEMTFVPRQQVLTLEEIYAVAEAFTQLGVTKIRLTGGEPLVRKGILSLVEKLGALPGLRELVMTTNGSRLDVYAAELKKAGIRRLNISLDSLRPRRFRELTRTGDLLKVLRGIDAALAAGFDRVKLNAVIMRGRNADEVLDLVTFALQRGLDLTFIEEMPLGAITEHDRAEVFIPSAELREMIAAVYPLQPSLEQSGGAFPLLDDSWIHAAYRIYFTA
jgi:cyclic pyranopterin phosphate synthase